MVYYVPTTIKMLRIYPCRDLRPCLRVVICISNQIVHRLNIFSISLVSCTTTVPFSSNIMVIQLLILTFCVVENVFFISYDLKISWILFLFYCFRLYISCQCALPFLYKNFQNKYHLYGNQFTHFLCNCDCKRFLQS